MENDKKQKTGHKTQIYPVTQQYILVSPSDVSKRLDIFVSEKIGVTRCQVQRLIKNGCIFVNNTIRSQSYKVKINDVIVACESEEKNETIVPESIPVKILYMDKYLAVLDKPADMVVYPAAGHKSGTLLNALFYHSKKLASIGGPLRPGVVHRLDKNTSGVMVVALDDMTYYGLTEQFKSRTINRKYKALVYGDIKGDSGEIALGIGRSASDRKKMSTRAKKVKEAITRWGVVERFRVATLIEAKLETGRTHQIRVHFSAIGHPVLGDKTYGKKIAVEVKRNKISFPRQMLHAETLEFNHPVTKKYIKFSSSMPEDMKDCIEKLSSHDTLRVCHY